MGIELKFDYGMLVYMQLYLGARARELSQLSVLLRLSHVPRYDLLPAWINLTGCPIVLVFPPKCIFIDST